MLRVLPFLLFLLFSAIVVRLGNLAQIVRLTANSLVLRRRAEEKLGDAPPACVNDEFPAKIRGMQAGSVGT